MVCWGQWVVGPPGSGKTTYSYAMKQLCTAMDRPVCVVNLDPANDTLIHDVVEDDKKFEEVDCRAIFDIDIRELITTEDVMDEFSLGPNGALLYAMEFIYTNLEWLKEKLKTYSTTNDCNYFIFDCPGQVEIYSIENEGGMRNILKDLTNEKHDDTYRLTAVHLVDSTLLKDLATYVSALFISMNCQIMLELPFVNLLTKVDLLNTVKATLGLPLRDYIEVENLQQLVESEARRAPKHAKRRWFFVSEMLSEVEDTNLTDFDLVDIHTQDSLVNVLGRIDRANGMALSGTLGGDDNVKQSVTKFSLSTPLNPFQQNDLLEEIIEHHMGNDDTTNEATSKKVDN
eukprot:GHVH01010793.1.p1 GENE.GHVH01010793.1~~GHVH01010793.1.p1  ORF type:complete len:359 (-),score=49.69 GHVH01010793.1:38-1066(-)